MLNPIMFYLCYIALGFISFLSCVLLGVLRQRRWGVTVFYCLIVAMVLLVGMRGLQVGTDTWQFASWVSASNSITDVIFWVEVVYFGLGVLGYKLGGMQFYLLLTAAVTIGCLFAGQRRLLLLHRDAVEQFGLGLVLPLAFFLTISASTFIFLVANQVRQAMAVGFLLLAISFLIERRMVAVCCCLFLMMFSHVASIMMIPVILLVRPLKTSQPMFVVSMVMLILGCAQVFRLVVESSGIDYVAERIREGIYTETKLSIYFKTVVLYLFATLFTFLKLPNRNRVYVYVLNIYLLVVGISGMAIEFGEGANRIQRFVVLLLPVLTVMAMTAARNKQQLFYLISATSILYFFFVMANGSFRATLGLY
ncbi:EpsG family protein [Halotalea alkalilenta]|uniref:EpsG family protein n=1 Tax=Halotalea alkalilenta TaxID=376489 RepID=UPI0004801DD2|nr:EpsG family protein [Halotalea alkalilenta]